MIAKINLLPWREEYRNDKRIEFFKIAGVIAVVAVLVVVGWDRVVNAQISNQQARNNMLNQKIAQLDVKVRAIAELKKRRSDLIDRMNVIQSLQTNRPEIVRIFDEWVTAVPDGVYLSTMSRNGKSISFSGYAESNNRVSSFMRNLSSSYKFHSPVLTHVVANRTLGEQGNSFNMHVQVTDPVPAEAIGEGL